MSIVPSPRRRHIGWGMSMRVFLSLFLAFAGCGLPPLSSEDVFGLSPTPKVWVLGLVRDAKLATPISGATVQLGPSTASSDLNGAFRLDELSPGYSTGTVSKAGFTALQFELTLRPGANNVALELAMPSCGACGANEVCDQAQGRCVLTATISGDIVDDCSGEGLAARVTVQGSSTCALAGKGFFQLKQLAPGGPHTLAAGHAGYQAYSTTLTLESGFNAVPKVRLLRVGGCTAPKPAEVACVCDTPSCQAPP